MMPSLTFSVVVPTHNRVSMLERALRSVLAQTFRDFEIVVVDDASGDETQRFLSSVKSDQCRTLRNQSNLGVSGSRNRGARESAGQYVVFLDDDDELRPQALESLAGLIAADPGLDFMWGGRHQREIDASGRVVASRDDDWHSLRAPLVGSDFLPLSLQIATNSAFAIRKSVFVAIGGFDEQLKISEDRDLFIRLARAGYRGGVVAETIIDVNGHVSGSLSRNTWYRIGPLIDLQVIEKHKEYLHLPSHRQFLADYLLVVYCGFLNAGDRRSAVKTLVRLRRLNGLRPEVLRMYVRYAPEFRALKSVIRYNSIRRIFGMMRSGPQDSATP